MMETIKEIFIIYGRIITILPLLLIVTLFMGKRSIGELPVFDFLIILTLGAVVGADIADPNIRHIHTAAAVIAIGLLQKVISKIVIKNGTFLVGNLRRISYSLDNILQMLREKDIFDIKDVELSIVEANGKLTVYKQSNKSSVTMEDLGIEKKHEGIAYPVIIEGEIYPSVLTDMNLSEKWLRNQLQKKGINKLDSIFFASINKNHELHFSFKNDLTKTKPEILH
jgi:uncharacterized membrane protein YcaP (DUF421 family)